MEGASLHLFLSFLESFLVHRYLFLDFFDVAVLVDFDLISFDFSCDFFTFLVQSRLNYYLHYLKGMIICEVFFLLADESVFLMD